MKKQLVCAVLLLGALRGVCAFADSTVEFHRTLSLEPSDHITLDVTVPDGNVTIAYSHAGEILVSATAQASEGQIPADFFDRGLTVERQGENVKVQFNPSRAPASDNLRVSYTINVPNWIVVNSKVGTGRQTISGVMGPVTAVSDRGDVKVLYVTSTVDARTGRGDIQVNRVGTAARVETGSGSIVMKDIGPGSSATVRGGAGSVDVDGVSGSFTGSTDAGELRVAGGVYDKWDLKSASGSIHIGADTESGFEIDAATRSGRLSVENDDMEVDGSGRACHQKVNGGGKLIWARSMSGNIFIR